VGTWAGGQEHMPQRVVLVGRRGHVGRRRRARRRERVALCGAGAVRGVGSSVRLRSWQWRACWRPGRRVLGKRGVGRFAVGWGVGRSGRSAVGAPGCHRPAWQVGCLQGTVSGLTWISVAWTSRRPSSPTGRAGMARARRRLTIPAFPPWITVAGLAIFNSRARGCGYVSGLSCQSRCATRVRLGVRPTSVSGVRSQGLGAACPNLCGYLGNW